MDIRYAVKHLASFSDDMTIYAVPPWTPESEAIVARGGDKVNELPAGVPANAKYFLEVSIAKEVVAGSAASPKRSLEEAVKVIIGYALNDA
ncbi:MAG: hypothetical protein GC190_17545 [Alphaproteobacteria bacterium]|nr:hypothetical protein [Alphaproteobacteria bacterium]